MFGMSRTKTSMEALPSEVMTMIFNNMEFEDLKQCRLVCRKWESLITSEIPMGVTVDDNEEGNVDFIKKVVKTKVTAKRIRDISTIHALLKPKRVNLLTQLEICGSIHQNFLCCVVPRLMNLHTLVIRGMSFLRNLNFDQKFILGNLRTLKIYSPFNPRSREGAIKPFVCRNTELLFGENLRGLLSNISCPSLETVVIDGDVDQLRLPVNVDWKNDVLMNFLETHSNTLKNVLIGESSILKLRVPRPNNKDLAVPHPQYKSLHVSFHGKGLGRYHRPVMPESLDWCQVIHKQKMLEYLNIGVLWYPYLTHVVCKLPTTLKYLSIYWNSTAFSTFDANIFLELTNLEQLELTFDGAGVEVLVNYFVLENCRKLKTLVLEQVLLSHNFIEAIPQLFPNLEMLYLFKCTNSEFEDIDENQLPQEDFGISRDALSDLLTMRTLQYLFVSADDFIGSTLGKREMTSWLKDCARYDAATNGYHLGVEPKYPDIFAN